MPYEHYGKWRAPWLDENGNQRSATYDDFRTADYWIEKKKKAEVEEIRRGLRSPHPLDHQVNDFLVGEMLVREVGVEDGDDYVNLKIDDEGLSDKYVHNHLTLFGTMLRAAASFRVPWLTHVRRRCLACCVVSSRRS